MSVSIKKAIDAIRYSKKYDKTSYFLYFLLICIPLLFFCAKALFILLGIGFIASFFLFKEGNLLDVSTLKNLPIDKYIAVILPIIIAIIVLSGYFAITCNNEINKKKSVLPKISELHIVVIQGLKLFIPVTICFIPFFISILLSTICFFELFAFLIVGGFNGFQGVTSVQLKYSLVLFANVICIFSLIGIITAFLILPLILNYCKSLSFLNIKYKNINTKLFLLTVWPLVVIIFTCLLIILTKEISIELHAYVIFCLFLEGVQSITWYISLYLTFPNLCAQIYNKE